MIEWTRFTPEHARRIQLQPAQVGALRWMTPEILERVAQFPAQTALRGGLPIACFGAVEIRAERAEIWALLAFDSGRDFVRLYRGAQRFIALLPHRRLEMTVDCEFAAGHRLARMLGFECEAERMLAIHPEGGDMALYARVR